MGLGLPSHACPQVQDIWRVTDSQCKHQGVWCPDRRVRPGCVEAPAARGPDHLAPSAELYRPRPCRHLGLRVLGRPPRACPGGCSPPCGKQLFRLDAGGLEGRRLWGSAPYWPLYVVVAPPGPEATQTASLRGFPLGAALAGTGWVRRWGRVGPPAWPGAAAWHRGRLGSPGPACVLSFLSGEHGLVLLLGGTQADRCWAPGVLPRRRPPSLFCGCTPQTGPEVDTDGSTHSKRAEERPPPVGLPGEGRRP